MSQENEPTSSEEPALSAADSESFDQQFHEMVEDMQARAASSAISDVMMSRMRQDFPRPSLWRQWFVFGGTLSAVAGVLAILWVVPWQTPGPVGADASEFPLYATPDGWYSKSHLPAIKLYFTRPSATPRVRQEVEENQILQEDDWLQFVFRAPVRWHIMIVSINEKGKISRYVPSGARSLWLAKGKAKVPAGEVLVLDGSLGKERLFVFGAKEPFAYTAVKSSLTKAWLKSKQRLSELAGARGSWKVLWSLTFTKRPKASTP